MCKCCNETAVYEMTGSVMRSKRDQTGKYDLHQPNILLTFSLRNHNGVKIKKELKKEDSKDKQLIR